MYAARTEAGQSDPRAGGVGGPISAARRGVALLVVGIALAACGHGGSGGGTTPSAELQQDFAKVLNLRLTALDDLQTVSAGVEAVARADAAAAAAAGAGDPNAAADLITSAANQSALAAPIAARARTDVFAYQTALNALEQEARKTAVPLSDTQRAKIAALCTTGRSEAEAIRATAAAYATEWPDYAGLAGVLPTWLQRNQRGQYLTAEASEAGYLELTSPYRSGISIGKASANAAEVARRSATDAMTNGIVEVRAAVTLLGEVPPPTPKPTPTTSTSPKPASAGT